MHIPEQTPLSTIEGGVVHRLETRKSAEETYETFYRLYDQSALLKRGFSIILQRVIHIDETEDRSSHFVVAHAHTPMLPIRRQFDRNHNPAHYIPYNSGDLIVASTNGQAITEYDVLNAHGTYRAYLNNTTHGYNPIHEKVEMTLQSDLAENIVTTEFNMATGDGVIHLDGQYQGWILSKRESARIKEDMLYPELIDEYNETVVNS